MKKSSRSPGFTIIEIITVVVVIAILASIVAVSYRGVLKQNHKDILYNDIKSATSQLKLEKSTAGSFPLNANELRSSENVTLSYTSNGKTFCLSAVSSKVSGVSYKTTNADLEPKEGSC